MNIPLIKKFRRVWMIGIGGSGMAGIAEQLISMKFIVSGSDTNVSEATERLKQLGAIVYSDHNADRVENHDVVIYSNAIHEDNVELRVAATLKIPIIPRAEMLAELMRLKTGVGISGSHGKTTITSLVGEILTEAKLNPTVIVGGRLRTLGTGVRSGSGDILVAEADEYEGSFLKLAPVVVLINNLDNDHLECYGGYSQLEDAFVQFANSVPFYGRVLVNIDEPSLQPLLSRFNRTIVTYGFSPQADVRALNVNYDNLVSSFDVMVNGEHAGRVKLSMPGKFNVLNALGAIAVGVEFGVDFKHTISALEDFKGVHRRFELIDEVNGIMVVTDFGHHPTAITATIEAAKSGWKRRIIAVFQAHLYSRTKELADQFGQSLLGADLAFILPIYPAREQPIEGVTSELIYKAARDVGHKNIHYVVDKSTVVDEVCAVARPGDMVMIIGAGDVDRLPPEMVAGLKR